MEYYQAPFAILNSIYDSTFFLAIGFHGFLLRFMYVLEEMVSSITHDSFQYFQGKFQ